MKKFGDFLTKESTINESSMTRKVQEVKDSLRVFAANKAVKFEDAKKAMAIFDRQYPDFLDHMKDRGFILVDDKGYITRIT